MKKKVLKVMIGVATITALFTGCAKTETEKTTSDSIESNEGTDIASEEQTEQETATEEKKTDSITSGTATVQVFIAASLSNSMEEIATMYQENHPDVEIVYNADSSGTLMQQIEEGATCDIFFSAATKQMKQLEEDGFVEDGTRVDLLNNKVVLITAKGSGTKVTGFSNLDKAESIAFADGSVPVGKYTRQILVKEGILKETEDISKITTQEISEALGGVEINECGNVSKVKEAVKEGSNEIGTVYYSDAYSVIDDVDIIAEATKEQSGDIIYPVALIKNEEADESEVETAKNFLEYIQTKEAKLVFEKYMFTIVQ